LRLWRESFLREFDNRIRPALQEAHPDMKEEEVEVFRRKWTVSEPVFLKAHFSRKLTLTLQYYFSYCEAGFASKTLGDAIITVGREGALELMEGIPL
jgi:cyclopropane-fatty-acyl-phospholipid synthase